MIYTFCVILIVLSLLGAGTLGVVALVCVCRRRRRGLFISLASIGICVLLGAGAFVTVLARGAVDVKHAMDRQRAQASAARQTRIAPVLSLTPGVAGVDDEYWDYDGFRDWYRVPIRYPYDVQSIDTLDRGGIEINTAGGKSSDPNTQCKQLLWGITEYTVDSRMALCHLEDYVEDDVPKPWAVLTFDSDNIQYFKSREAMLEAASAAGFAGERQLQSVKQRYTAYWSR